MLTTVLVGAGVSPGIAAGWQARTGDAWVREATAGMIHRRSPTSARTRRFLRGGLVMLGVALLLPIALIIRAQGRAPTAAPPLPVASQTPSVVGAPAGIPPTARSAPAAPSTSPSRTERRTFASRALGRSMPYLVFLPPGYDADRDARFPVLYMLHGLGGDLTEWTEYQIFEQADQLIHEGAIPPLLIVLPEGGQSYWMDHAGGPRWGAYVARDLVAEIDGRYRTRADRAHRAVGGNSMGAHGALQLSLNHPEVFGVAGAHSPTLRRRDTLPAYFGDQAHFEAHDPPTLVERRPEVARGLRLWLDVGDGDFWRGPAEALHQRLVALDVAHEFHVLPGPHEDEYWRGNVPAYLRFYGDALH